MHCYPVYFRAGGPVVAEDFVASARISGRFLIQIGEGERTEVYTVNPAGVYVAAGSLREAVKAAVNELGRGLSVLAQDSHGYDEFEKRAERLVERPLKSLEERWAEACSVAADLPERDEFVRLAEVPPVEIESVLVCERPQLRPQELQMAIGDLQQVAA